MDPHTAIGVAAARAQRWSKQTPMICLATAHAAKFPESIAQARTSCNELPEPELPEHMQNLFEKPEQFSVLANELGKIQSFVRENI